jgi:hypothetical protein
MSNDLFPMPVPVTVAFGEYGSGKTLWVLTTGYPLERTLVYDNEKSSEVYNTEQNPFVRVDLPTLMLEKHPKGYKPIDFYRAWVENMRSITPGKYDVIGIDTAEPLEEGIAEWVTANASYFGHSAGQYQKMSGLFWGDVKNLWKQHILEMTSRCKMVIITVHMRDEFKNNNRTGKRQRKGKDTLSELATLELELVRKPGQMVPSARIHKERFFSGSLADIAHARPILDPWLPEASWAKIREYMLNPADPTNPQLEPEDPEAAKAEELYKLELQAKIAEAQLAQADGAAVSTGGNGSAPKEKCPMCGATAAPDTDTGHAPWCKLQSDGTRARVELAKKGKK